MDSKNFNKLSEEVLLEYIKGLEHEELRSKCRANRKFRRICKEHEDEIYTNLLIREYGEWTHTPRLIYNALNSGYVFKKKEQHIILQSVINTNKKYELYALLKEYKFNVETEINGKTLLQYAVKRHDLPIECINVLLDFNANIDAVMFGGSTPFLYLLGDEIGDVPSELLLRMLELNPKQKDRYCDTMFHIGFNNNTLDAVVIEKLLSFNFDINEHNVMDNTPLHLLIEKNSDKLNDRMMKRVITLSPDFNLTNLVGNTVLILAVQNYFENTNVLEPFLLEILKTSHLDINITNNSGWSAIMEALANDAFPSSLIQKMLKMDELNVEEHITREKEQTLLMQCVSHSSANVLYELIMAKKPNTSVTDTDNNTAAMIAVKEKNLSHVNVLKLIKQTDNLMQKNLSGYNLLELCLRYVRSNIINDICDYILSKVTLEVTNRMAGIAEHNRFLNRANRTILEGIVMLTTSDSGSE